MAEDEPSADDIEPATVGGTQIQAVKDDDIENILGWTVIYTIGPDFTVGRSWLESRASELGIDSRFLPPETSSKRAYTRACKRLEDYSLGAARHPDVEAVTEREDHSTFAVELIDRRPDDSVSHPVIGHIVYEDGQPIYETKTSETEYVETFSKYRQQMDDEFALQKESNTGGDIRRMVREFAKHKDSAGVKMRDAGAVYFVPRQAGDGLMKLKTLVKEINESWKTSGFQAAVDTIEVIDSAEKRNMVERKVRRTLDTIVESALEGAFDELDEETAAQDVVGDVGAELVRAENVAAEHNALLDVEMSVEETLEEWKDRVSSEEKEKLVEAAMKEVDV